MAYYVIYNDATGELESQGVTISLPLPPGRAFKDITFPPDLLTYVWDKTSRNYALKVLTKAEFEELKLGSPYERWKRWKDMLEEATVRGLPSQYITALTNKVDAVWDDLKNAVLEWHDAA